MKKKPTAQALCYENQADGPDGEESGPFGLKYGQRLTVIQCLKLSMSNSSPIAGEFDDTQGCRARKQAVKTPH